MTEMKLIDVENKVKNRLVTESWLSNPFIDMNLLTEEVGELAREIRRSTVGRQRPDETDNNYEDIVNSIGSEIGDILFSLVKIANYYGLRLERCIELHEEKMNIRYSNKEEV